MGKSPKKRTGAEGLVEPFAALSGRQIAALFAVSPQSVTRWTQQGCPRRPDRRYNLAAVIQWRLSLAEAMVTEPEAATNPGSAQLERQRAANADLLELQLRERRRELVPRADLLDGLALLSQILRRAGERIGKQFGTVAHQMLDDAISEFDQEAKRRFNAG
jgi:phage terminase Nu1 subunit (DNA packaging protein)